MTFHGASLRCAKPVASTSLDRRGSSAAVGEGQASSSPLANEGEGAFLIFRPLADPILSGAMTVPVIGRECEHERARPMPSVAETHLGKIL